VDPGSILNVSFHDSVEDFIRMDRPDVKFSANKISASEALAHMDELEQIQKYYKKRRAAVGFGEDGDKRPRSGVGRNMFDSIVEKTKRLTFRRSNAVKDRNHLWTKKIVDHAVRQRCEMVNFLNFPEGVLFDVPWNWYQFDTMIQYKLHAVGIKHQGLPKRTIKKSKREDATKIKPSDVVVNTGEVGCREENIYQPVA
jgi:hypothetical protein